MSYHLVIGQTHALLPNLLFVARWAATTTTTTTDSWLKRSHVLKGTALTFR